MKHQIFFFLFLILFSSCTLREREEALKNKEAQLNQKEQELLILQQTLQAKEEDLQQREKQLDSTKQNLTDSFSYHPEVVGTWLVKMNCTETSCEGYAVGDSKTETWEINYQNNLVIARVIVAKKLVRFYTGSYTGDVLNLETQEANANNQQTTKMNVTLQQTADNKMQGQRELIHENCKVVYTLDLSKQ